MTCGASDGAGRGEQLPQHGGHWKMHYHVKNILSIVMILMIVDCYSRQEGTCALRIRRIHSLRCSRSLKTPGEVFIIIIIGIIIMALVMAMMMMTKITTDQ